MSSAPNRCPNCGVQEPFWRSIAVNKRGLSAGKALVGGVVAGPVGAIVGGVMGKKYTTWACAQCGFMCEYDYNDSDEWIVEQNNRNPINSPDYVAPVITAGSIILAYVKFALGLEYLLAIFCYMGSFTPSVLLSGTIIILVVCFFLGCISLKKFWNNNQTLDILNKAVNNTEVIRPTNAVENFSAQPVLPSTVSELEAIESAHVVKQSSTSPVSPSVAYASQQVPSKSVNKNKLLNAIKESNFSSEAFQIIMADMKFDVNMQDREGKTLMMVLAAVSPNPELISILLNAGANAYLTDKNGSTALDYAKKYNNKATLSVLSATCSL